MVHKMRKWISIDQSLIYGAIPIQNIGQNQVFKKKKKISSNYSKDLETRTSKKNRISLSADSYSREKKNSKLFPEFIHNKSTICDRKLLSAVTQINQISELDRRRYKKISNLPGNKVWELFVPEFTKQKYISRQCDIDSSEETCDDNFIGHEKVLENTDAAAPLQTDYNSKIKYNNPLNVAKYLRVIDQHFSYKSICKSIDSEYNSIDNMVSTIQDYTNEYLKVKEDLQGSHTFRKYKNFSNSESNDITSDSTDISLPEKPMSYFNNSLYKKNIETTEQDVKSYESLETNKSTTILDREASSNYGTFNWQDPILPLDFKRKISFEKNATKQKGVAHVNVKQKQLLHKKYLNYKIKNLRKIQDLRVKIKKDHKSRSCNVNRVYTELNSLQNTNEYDINRDKENRILTTPIGKAYENGKIESTISLISSHGVSPLVVNSDISRNKIDSKIIQLTKLAPIITAIGAATGSRITTLSPYIATLIKYSYLPDIRISLLSDTVYSKTSVPKAALMAQPLHEAKNSLKRNRLRILKGALSRALQSNDLATKKIHNVLSDTRK